MLACCEISEADSEKHTTIKGCIKVQLSRHGSHAHFIDELVLGKAQIGWLSS